jgi:outer membrane protein assembly factor BamB
MRTLPRPPRRAVIASAAAAGAMLLASVTVGAAATTLAKWSLPGFTAGDTNYNTSETTLGQANVAALSERSSRLLPASALAVSNILSVGSTQYVEYDTKDSTGQYFEHVTAINLAKGKVRWTSTSAVSASLSFPDTGLPGPIAYQSGVIYASAYDHLDAINATSGSILWSYTPAQQTGDLHFEAAAGGSVFVRDGYANQNIDAVNATTGALLWTFPTGEPIQDAAYSNGTLYVGSGDHYVYAVSTTSGAQKWSRFFGEGSPYVAYAGGVVYVADLTSVEALKPTGGLIWQRTLRAGANAPMVIGDGEAFYTDGWEMTALSTTANGALEWSLFGGTPGNCDAVGANAVIYCANPTGDVEAYNATTGQTLWSASLPGGVTASPIVVNGCVYLATSENGQLALRSYCA